MAPHVFRLLPPRKDLRVESEEGQAQFRFQSALVVTLGLAVCYPFVRPEHLSDASVSVVVYFVFAYVWVWMVTCNVGATNHRQWAALVLDHGIYCVGLAWGGAVLAPLLWVPLTSSVGHGLRFGERRAYAAALFGALCVYGALTLSPRWPSAPLVHLGLALATLIVPLYVVRLVRTIATQRVLAETKATELEYAVRRDPLTKLLNRTGLDHALKEISDSSGRTRQPLGLIVLDLDGFKAVNDTLGHEAGDLVLQRVGAQIAVAVRATDSVARLGGDEFAVLLKTPADLSALEQVAAKLLLAVQAARPPHQPGLALGASLGVCLVPPGVQFDAALRVADSLMFQAKRGGKNQHRAAELDGSGEPLAR